MCRFLWYNIVMDEYKDKKGVWRTINGVHIFIEDGKSIDEAFDDVKSAGKLLGVSLKPKPVDLTERHFKAMELAKSNALPKGIKPEENIGGTMDEDGNPVDMRKFPNGYLVSCGNDSFPENREFLYSEKGKDFISRFLAYSSDGRLYVGSWYSKGENGNEPTIWIKDKDTAMFLAKKLGQYQITDCAAYNKHKLQNYTKLTEKQSEFASEIFIDVADDETHKVKLEEADI